jgi:ubiquinone/menaquinone biosynthesis C-methylase UbiE
MSLQDQVATVGAAWHVSPYYEDAEKWTHLFWGSQTEFRKMFDQLDLASVIELACGHGRHAERIKDIVEQLILIDIVEENLLYCQRRLGTESKLTYIKGDGITFHPVVSDSVTAIFCYDAMVHFSPEMVESYLRDSARVLKPGGMALFHHSNYPASLEKHYGQNPLARNHMTVGLFGKMAQDVGLRVEAFKTIKWGNYEDLDAISLVRRPR